MLLMSRRCSAERWMYATSGIVANIATLRHLCTLRTQGPHLRNPKTSMHWTSVSPSASASAWSRAAWSAACPRRVPRAMPAISIGASQPAMTSSQLTT